MTMLVRIKPYDKKKGYVLQRYNYAGILFDVRRGWYEVSEEIAKYLKTIRQVGGIEETPFAFDVCTKEEARTLDDTEREAALPKRMSADPVVTASAIEAGKEPAQQSLPELSTDRPGKKR